MFLANKMFLFIAIVKNLTLENRKSLLNFLNLPPNIVQSFYNNPT